MELTDSLKWRITAFFMTENNIQLKVNLNKIIKLIKMKVGSNILTADINLKG